MRAVSQGINLGGGGGDAGGVNNNNNNNGGGGDAIKFVGKKKSKKQHRQKKQAASASASDSVATSAVVVAVDDESLPVQDREDAAPINAVGFEPGVIQYVRPAPDPVQVPGQRYWVLSYVTSGGEKIRSKNTMVKCSGAFADEEAARARAKQIRDDDPRISVFVVDMYVFVSVPIPDQVFASIPKHYDDDRLDRIMRQSQLDVKRDGERLAQRTKADKEKALRSLRRAKGDDTYVPPEHDDLATKHLKEQDEYDRRARDSMVDVVDIVDAMNDLRHSGGDRDGAAAGGESTLSADVTQDVCAKLLAKLKLKRDERAAREEKQRAAADAAAASAGLEVPPHPDQQPIPEMSGDAATASSQTI